MWFKRKKDEPKRKLPDLPAFPGSGSGPAENQMPQFPSFPKYEPEFQKEAFPSFPELKSEAKKDEQRFPAAPLEQPKKLPEIHDVPDFIPQRQPSVRGFNEQQIRPEPKKAWEEEHHDFVAGIPTMQRAAQSVPGVGAGAPVGTERDKPIFVKIENYREAVSDVDNLKQKIKEIDYILGKLEEIRMQEQSELSNFQNNLNRVKEKLVAIDKKLFEV